MNNEKLYKIAEKLLTPKKGILAADQSSKTIGKQLQAIGVDPTAENRRRYRQLLFTTPDIDKYVNGIIFYDSTIRNETDKGEPFVDHILSKGIIPIIKVDKGTADLDGFPGELVTEGLDGLDARLAEYFHMGARAAKWRAVVNISDALPTTESIKFNCLLLARYSILCQKNGLVPIVEPEVIYKGTHDIKKAAEVTELTLKTLFAVLSQYRVDLKGVILKSSMVLAGSENENQSTPEEVAKATIKVFMESVPKSIPGIVFLSGGQTPEQATANLNAIAQIEKERGGLPWQIAFSFSRGIEKPVQDAWQGKEENVEKAKQVLIETLKQNSLADQGAL